MYVSKKFLDEIVGTAETDRIAQEPIKYKAYNGIPADGVNDADEVNNIFDDISPEYDYSEDIDYDESDEQFESDDNPEKDGLFRGTYKHPVSHGILNKLLNKK